MKWNALKFKIIGECVISFQFYLFPDVIKAHQWQYRLQRINSQHQRKHCIMCMSVILLLQSSLNQDPFNASIGSRYNWDHKLFWESWEEKFGNPCSNMQCPHSSEVLQNLSVGDLFFKGGGGYGPMGAPPGSPIPPTNTNIILLQDTLTITVTSLLFWVNTPKYT